MIELHCHTTASDGTLTPVELATRAGEMGLTCLAITDHDSTAGIEPALEICRREGIRLIPAVELSTAYDGRPMDILGYGVDIRHPTLVRALEDMIDRRNSRTPKMIQRLRAAGVDISAEDVAAASAGYVIGRPHVARALVNRGVVRSVQEAFDTYLARGRIGYVPKDVLQPHEAIRFISEAGGLAVLAHPRYLKLDAEPFDHMLDTLTAQGLRGIEVYYSQNTSEEVDRYARVAEARGLVVTGGSDFHGENKPHIELGIGPGETPLADCLAEDLLAALDG